MGPLSSFQCKRGKQGWFVKLEGELLPRTWRGTEREGVLRLKLCGVCMSSGCTRVCLAKGWRAGKGEGSWGRGVDRERDPGSSHRQE